MSKTIAEIKGQIATLEEARKVTRARNGYRHYSERINYLKGELALAQAALGNHIDHCPWCGATRRATVATCLICGHDRSQDEAVARRLGE